MVLTVKLHFCLVQPHYFVSLGRTIESGNYDSGPIHPPSQIEAAGTVARGHAVQTLSRRTQEAQAEGRFCFESSFLLGQKVVFVSKVRVFSGRWSFLFRKFISAREEGRFRFESSCLLGKMVVSVSEGVFSFNAKVTCSRGFYGFSAFFGKFAVDRGEMESPELAAFHK